MVSGDVTRLLCEVLQFRRIQPATLALRAVVNLNPVDRDGSSVLATFETPQIGRRELTLRETNLQLSPYGEMLIIQMAHEAVYPVCNLQGPFKFAVL